MVAPPPSAPEERKGPSSPLAASAGRDSTATSASTGGGDGSAVSCFKRREGGGGWLCTQRSQRRSAVELVHKRFFNITFLGTVGRRRENYWSAGDDTFVRVYAVCAGNGRNEGRRNCAHVRACLCLLVWKYIAPGGDAKLAVLSYLVNCGGGGSAISGGGGGKGKQHQR